MFDLKRPCTNCPFRKGKGELFSLPEPRLDEIFSATAFQCHKTHGNRPQQCAGVMAILAKEGRPNQIMQVAKRIDNLHFDDIDPENEAHMSIKQAKNAHSGKFNQ